MCGSNNNRVGGGLPHPGGGNYVEAMQRDQQPYKVTTPRHNNVENTNPLTVSSYEEDKNSSLVRDSSGVILSVLLICRSIGARQAQALYAAIRLSSPTKKKRTRKTSRRNENIERYIH